MSQIAQAGLVVLLLAIGFALGVVWSSRTSFISAHDAWSSYESCVLYFAENAATSKGAEISLRFCRTASQ
ncbi:hypothetical protein ACQKFL_11385 [Vreelandella titanicae]|uniref:hypothetical protein n=1 Tax=Vreelandella titanicae TaxID=664683 RepID=UPI003CFD598B|tara:strand:+ start:2065 stop:2274 length:210 start_codon:yes stop_codon:yes gene_type:complete